MQFIDTRTHGIIDYATGAVLIVAPYLFGFATGGIEQWLPMSLGALTIGVSLITRYELSAAKIMPLGVHLSVDVAVGALLAVSPWLFGFSHVIWWPHLLVGLLSIAVPLMTKREPEARAASMRRR